MKSRIQPVLLASALAVLPFVAQADDSAAQNAKPQTPAATTAQATPADAATKPVPAQATAQPVPMKVDPSTVVATVDGVNITAAQIVMLRQQLPQQYQSLPPDTLFDGLVQQAVNQQLFAEQVPVTTPAVQAQIDNEVRAIKAESEIARVAQAGTTDAALQELYNQKYATAGSTTEYHAAHILVSTEDQAKAVEAELKKGTAFADVAKRESSDTSAANGGDLGWFSDGTMVPEFQAAVEKLKPGEVSAPVKTQFGWHVIELIGTRQKDAPKLDDVRDELTQDLQQQVVTAKRDALMDKAKVDRKTAQEVDLSFMSDPDFLN